MAGKFQISFRTPEQAERLIEHVAERNLRDHPELVRLGTYRLGIPYGREKKGDNRILDIYEMIHSGEPCDCDDHVAARLAERWQRGENAWARVVPTDDPKMRHSLIQDEFGLEDPSRAQHPLALDEKEQIQITPDGFAVEYTIDGDSRIHRKTLLFDSPDGDMDVAGVWDAASSALIAALPTAAKVVQAGAGTAFPTYGLIADVMRQNPELRARLAAYPRSTIARIARKRANLTKKMVGTDLMCRLQQADRANRSQQAFNYALCHFRNRKR